MKTVIVWFRNDLRVHDHPTLAAAVAGADRIIPLFILQRSLLDGHHASPNRNRFLHQCLEDLRDSLRNLGSDLAVLAGDPAQILPDVASQYGADKVFTSTDYSPFAIMRDKRVQHALATQSVALHLFPGRLAIDNPETLRTQAGTPYKVFTPFWKQWQQIERRSLAKVPQNITSPHLPATALPDLRTIQGHRDLSPHTLEGGECAGRARLQAFLKHDIHSYHQQHNDLAANSTSRLSPYLHFGCLSVREIETMLPQGDGPAAWHRQLAWRDFYHYILQAYPDNATQEFQERYRDFAWRYDDDDLTAWQAGRTGYPIVDAAMRQLRDEGWMHNRARLIVGSFLTKDLLLDWRLGETYFMRMLLDGDEANNNGNWQWIASVGVDPAPVFRRLYNPSSQQKTYDPTNAYVRKYVPELGKVPDAYISEPWTMPETVQRQAACIIGKDYPAPIVDHALARKVALEQYRR